MKTSIERLGGIVGLSTVLLLGGCGTKGEVSELENVSPTTASESIEESSESTDTNQTVQPDAEENDNGGTTELLRSYPELSEYIAATSEQMIDPEFDTTPISERGGLYLKYLEMKYGVDFVKAKPSKDSAEDIVNGFWQNLVILDEVASANPEDAAKAVSGIYYYDEEKGITAPITQDEDGGLIINGASLAYGETARYAKGMPTTLASEITITDSSIGQNSSGNPTENIIYTFMLQGNEFKMKQSFEERSISDVWMLNQQTLGS